VSFVPQRIPLYLLLISAASQIVNSALDDSMGVQSRSILRSLLAYCSIAGLLFLAILFGAQWPTQPPHYATVAGKDNLPVTAPRQHVVTKRAVDPATYAAAVARGATLTCLMEQSVVAAQTSQVPAYMLDTGLFRSEGWTKVDDDDDAFEPAGLNLAISDLGDGSELPTSIGYLNDKSKMIFKNPITDPGAGIPQQPTTVGALS
jgi:hypothetical protein